MDKEPTSPIDSAWEAPSTCETHGPVIAPFVVKYVRFNDEMHLVLAAVCPVCQNVVDYIEVLN